MPPIVKTRIVENKYSPFLTYINPPALAVDQGNSLPAQNREFDSYID